MCRANKAILRERYPIPTVDEILQSLNDSKVFSKLDLRWGYHQLELIPDSREITMFVTHCGLFRHKRLLFRVISASEQYQHEIQTALAGKDGQNISDDIIMHDKDQAKHDVHPDLVIKRLGERGLTLNAAKFQFSRDKLTLQEEEEGEEEEQLLICTTQGSHSLGWFCWQTESAVLQTRLRPLLV